MNPLVTGPEATINAANAALAAQQSAFYASVLAMVSIALAVILIIGLVVIVVKIHRVEKHTNSIVQQLIVASRALGVAEGEDLTRAAAAAAAVKQGTG